MPQGQSQVWRLRVIAAMVAASSGCQMLPARSGAGHPPTGRVTQVVPLWSEALLRNDNVPVAQGFAAKVYLYGPNSHEPVTARGKFTVYAYDDTDVQQASLEQAHTKPDRVWQFEESELKPLLKKDAIGWSYSIWLPYSSPAPHARRCSLILSFAPQDGSPILSQPTLVTLPAVRGAK